MNKKEFLARFDEIVKQEAEKLLKDYSEGKNLKELVEKTFIKSWRKLVLIDFKVIILITFIDKIKENTSLYQKYNLEIKNSEKFYNSIRTCEYYIYLLFTELEKILGDKL